MADGTLIEPPAKSVAHATAKFAQYAATQAVGKEKLNSAMNKAILKSPKALRSAVFDALNIQKTMKRSLRHIKDVVEIRTNRIVTEWTGGAVELMRELQYEYHTQYINYMTFQAKEKATKDLNLIDAMRRSLGAAGLVVVFETWRDYVVNKKIRERRDAEKQYEREIKQFATAMQSVKIAQHHVSLWKRCVDIYTDQVTCRTVCYTLISQLPLPLSTPSHLPLNHLSLRFSGSTTRRKRQPWWNQASTTTSPPVSPSPPYPQNCLLGNKTSRPMRRTMSWRSWLEGGWCRTV